MSDFASWVDGGPPEVDKAGPVGLPGQKIQVGDTMIHCSGEREIHNKAFEINIPIANDEGLFP